MPVMQREDYQTPRSLVVAEMGQTATWPNIRVAPALLHIADARQLQLVKKIAAEID